MSKKAILAITILLYMAGCASLSSCYNSRKAGVQVGKAMTSYPVQTAQQLRDRWPCVTTGADTVNRVDTTFDWIEIPCPDSVIMVPTSGTEYAEKIVYKTKSVPQAVRTITNTITQKVKDSAEIFILYDVLNGKDKVISDRDQKITDLEDKITRKNKRIKWLIIFLIGLSIPYIIRLVRLVKF